MDISCVKWKRFWCHGMKYEKVASEEVAIFCFQWTGKKLKEVWFVFEFSKYTSITEVTQYCYHGCSTRMTRWYCFSNTSANLEAMRKEIHYKSYELYLFSSKKLSLDRRAHRKVSLTCSWQQDSWPPSTRVKWYTFTSTFSWIYNVS